MLNATNEQRDSAAKTPPETVRTKILCGGRQNFGKITTFFIELFDVRNSAKSGNKNGCQIVTQLAAESD
jgi:hypothetical protein